MRLTLGDEAALTDETMTEALRRVTDEIKADEHGQVLAEQANRRATEAQLAAVAQERDRLRVVAAYRRCERNANRCSWAVAAALTAVLAIALLGGLGLLAQGIVPGAAVSLASVVVAVLTFVNLRAGTTVRDLQSSLRSRLLAGFLRREEERSSSEDGGSLDA